MTGLTDIPLRMNDGRMATLADWQGKVVLVVNVASKCGLTPQYAALEALYRAHGDAGFTVLGVPSNDFRGQEPGTDAEILEFCTTAYDVTFPLAARTPVSGDRAHPLYAALAAACPVAQGEGPMRERLETKGPANPPPQILWNFEKFLIGRDGQVLARFAPDVTPDDPRVTTAIRAALAA
ncbi:MAG TPA: glutathione peroxidase [Paracoccus sp. (in: a-proteobacteria)]|nr:glutathione peroxidase [Paracoccus sp. (in: a-proteobacteria)]